MALIEMFIGDTDEKRERLLNVLNQGLLAAEDREPALWSGSDDLRIQFTRKGELEPDWLNQVNPELAAIYRSWLAENRTRVEAVLNKSR